MNLSNKIDETNYRTSPAHGQAHYYALTSNDTRFYLENPQLPRYLGKEKARRKETARNIADSSFTIESMAPLRNKLIDNEIDIIQTLK